MSLIECHKCGKKISDKAEKCPNCDCPITSTSSDNSSIKKGQSFYEKHSQPNKFWGLLVLSISISPILPALSGFGFIFWLVWIPFYFKYKKDNINPKISVSKILFIGFVAIGIAVSINDETTTLSTSKNTVANKSTGKSTAYKNNPPSVKSPDACYKLKSLFANHINEIVACYNFFENKKNTLNFLLDSSQSIRKITRQAAPNHDVDYDNIRQNIDILDTYQFSFKSFGEAVWGEKKFKLASQDAKPSIYEMKLRNKTQKADDKEYKRCTELASNIVAQSGVDGAEFPSCIFFLQKEIPSSQCIHNWKNFDINQYAVCSSLITISDRNAKRWGNSLVDLSDVGYDKTVFDKFGIKRAGEYYVWDSVKQAMFERTVSIVNTCNEAEKHNVLESDACRMMYEDIKSCRSIGLGLEDCQ